MKYLLIRGSCGVGPGNSAKRLKQTRKYKESCYNKDNNMCLQIADYYYEERFCILRCVLHILTYFQDERHPYMVCIGFLS